MPRIEIVGIRFNLDKDKDRVLFEKLKTADAGKRNDFVKQVLYEALLGADPNIGSKVSRSSKKSHRESVDVSAAAAGPPVAERTRPVGKESTSKSPEPERKAGSQTDTEGQRDVDAETSEFVRSFVQ